MKYLLVSCFFLLNLTAGLAIIGGSPVEAAFTAPGGIVAHADGEVTPPTHGDRLNPESGQLETVPLDSEAANGTSAHERDPGNQKQTRNLKIIVPVGLAVVAAVAVAAAHRLKKR